MGIALRKLTPLGCLFDDDLVDDDTAFIGRYQGETNLLGEKHGYGSYCFTNGDIYEGCWKDDLMHGYGTYKYASGKKKEGFFDHGKYIGKEVKETDSEIYPEPFVQTVRDEKVREERRLRREQAKKEREKRKKEREKGWAEIKAKYGDRSRTQQNGKYSATKSRQWRG